MKYLGGVLPPLNMTLQPKNVREARVATLGVGGKTTAEAFDSKPLEILGGGFVRFGEDWGKQWWTATLYNNENGVQEKRMLKTKKVKWSKESSGLIVKRRNKTRFLIC